MATTEDEILGDLDEAAAKLSEEGLAEPVVEPESELLELPPIPIKRLGLVVAFPTFAAAVMAGGIFVQFGARFWGALCGVLGIGLAIFALRVRRPTYMNLLVVAGIFLIGILPTLPAGDLSDVLNVGAFVKEAIKEGDVGRPPVTFTLGWRAILGWLMAGVGFAAAWTAMEIKKPAIALMSPLPILAITAISVPKDAQLVSGLACLVLFAVGLGLLSGTRFDGDDDEKPPLAYELRRAAKAIPMLAGVTGVLFFLATNTEFLFPKPLYDPTKEAQRPRTQPLSEVKDRVLFTVDSKVTGPWRMGGLDVYDGKDWRLPPFADNRIREVPKSGVVEPSLTPGVSATFVIRDLGGAVLPGLPNLVGLKAEGPLLAYDNRTGNIRLAQGTIQNGMSYTVVAASIPTVEALKNATGKPPKEVRKFLEMPDAPPPPAVQALIDKLPKDAPPWDKLDALRQEFLKTVTAKGAGTPVPIGPAKVQDMFTGSKEGTPFEIVAAQAMMARWVGIPSRIGYGFDRGDDVNGVLEVRPKHGASYLEIYFPTYQWLPVIGTPQQAKSSIASEESQFNSNVLPSDEIAVRLFVPVATDPKGFLFEQIRAVLLVVVPIILALLILYYTWPALRKAFARGRRRSWAIQQGPAARIALAYSEWRDLCTDFGYRHEADTPLMFLDRVVDDEEHTELSWLITRTLWGDRRHEIALEDATAAEELSRSLRRRLSQGHQATLRVIAAVSRLSLRHPYAPTLGARETKRKGGQTLEEEAA